MPAIQIRPATPADFASLLQIEHSYQSVYVWQMDRLMNEGEVVINFREIRLPRPVRVEYCRSRQMLAESWPKRLAVLAAVMDDVPVGYISLTDHFSPNTVGVTDLAVNEKVRRKGIGMALILAAQEWALEHAYRRMIIEMQSKNFASIQLMRKLGYEFCGYNDHYYANQDIALFFGKFLR